MKSLGWILLLSTSTLFAQVIEPAPLSIENEESSRPIVIRKEGDTEIKHIDKAEVVTPPAQAEIVIPNDEVLNPQPAIENKKKKTQKKAVTASKAKAKIIETTSEEILTSPAIVPAPNPLDGQLKLEVSKDSAKEALKNEVAKVEAHKNETDAPVLVPVAFLQHEPRKYIQYAFGYINSRYEKIHPNLDNGSVQTSLKFIGDVNSHVQVGFGIEILTDTSTQDIPDNIRSLQYRLFGEYHAPLTSLGSIKIDWVAGAALAIGEFGIKRRYLNTQNEEVSVKLKNGTLIGLIPTSGLRFYLVGPYSVDFMVEYHQYFGNPQKYIGGLAISPRLNFPF